jgi:hypothetical protein
MVMFNVPLEEVTDIPLVEIVTFHVAFVAAAKPFIGKANGTPVFALP